MRQGTVKGRGRGRPRQRPGKVCADKGYSSGTIRRSLRQRGIGVVIPHKSNERRRGPFDQAVYRERARIEHCFNRLKQFRRIATRYEKLAANYAAMLTIACIMLWL
jgi:transposase